MSLMFRPHTHSASSAQPLLQERSFCIRLRCTDCDRERSQIVRMLDEPNDPATSHEFFDSGALKEVDPDCMYCGHTGATILGVSYILQPGDGVGATE